MGLSDAQSLTLGGGLQNKGAPFPPLQSHAENPLPHYPQAIGPIPSPNPTLQTHIPIHLIQFQIGRRRHQQMEIVLGPIHLHRLRFIE